MARNIDENIEIKKCTNKDCKNPVLLATEDFFYKQKVNTKKTGSFYKLMSWCKECIKEAQAKRNKLNKDEYKEYQKEYREANKEKHHKQIKKWKAQNSEYFKQYMRDYRKNNKDKIKYYNDYKSMHKAHDISLEEWEVCKEYFNSECAYCGIELSEHYVNFGGGVKRTDFHKEHVNHEGENDISNCVPSCKSCNSKKWTFAFEDWYSEDNPIYNDKRKGRIMDWLSLFH